MVDVCVMNWLSAWVALRVDCSLGVLLEPLGWIFVTWILQLAKNKILELARIIRLVCAIAGNDGAVVEYVVNALSNSLTLEVAVRKGRQTSNAGHIFQLYGAYLHLPYVTLTEEGLEVLIGHIFESTFHRRC